MQQTGSATTIYEGLEPITKQKGAGSPNGAQHRREVKFAQADLTAVQADGTFSGYASLFGRTDLARDMVMPGAFAASLKRRGAAGVKLLFQHDAKEPIGVWDDIREDGAGLFVRGRLMPDVSRAREVLSLMRAGAIDGLSIGFRTIRGRTDATTGVRRLLEVDLWEISVVTFPMLPEARISAVKAARQRRPAMRAGGRVVGAGDSRLAATLRAAADLMHRKS